jgi:hypothetical protein
VFGIEGCPRHPSRPRAPNIASSVHGECSSGSPCLTISAVVGNDSITPAQATLSPDQLTTWPLDDQRYGLVAVFRGDCGYERATRHRARLEREGVPRKLRRERDGAWTLRFGPVSVPEVSGALDAFMNVSTEAIAAR